MITKKTGLDLLREPFPAHQISKLPKPTKAQTEAIQKDFKAGIRCQLCGGWHHPQVIHLDYVGHAALTDRLLDCDPMWSWEPMSLGSDGYPVIDSNGGMWIKLTICGVTRLGYGDAQGKTGGDAMKERIGDALRNAAMRFGAALDLWHKGDLHIDDAEKPDVIQDEQQTPKQEEYKQDDKPWYNSFEQHKDKMIDDIADGKTPEQILSGIRKKYKVSKQIAEQIEALGDVL